MDAMLEEMTMSEYVHWQAIYDVEPFPEARADLRLAEQLRMMMITAHAKEVPRIENLIPDWWGERRPRAQSPAQIKANMELIQSASRRKKK